MKFHDRSLKIIEFLNSMKINIVRGFSEFRKSSKSHFFPKIKKPKKEQKIVFFVLKIPKLKQILMKNCLF